MFVELIKKLTNASIKLGRTANEYDLACQYLQSLHEEGKPCGEGHVMADKYLEKLQKRQAKVIAVQEALWPVMEKGALN